ncbi:MAG TPA: hypothetical protein VH300_01860 [Thermoleophilaceae bacterium]|jgi:hypothetical protein|nr:hypothetical protein [Thermoleophilaceae bacterium]
MNSQINLQIAQEHIADLHRSAAASRRGAPVIEDVKQPTAVIALRLAWPDESDELAELAALDSQRPLRGHALIALVDGKLVAAISLLDGRVIADPLAPTGEAQALLETRARQLALRPRRPRRRRFRLRFA